MSLGIRRFWLRFRKWNYSIMKITEKQILEIIDSAKKFDKGKCIDKLSKIVYEYNKTMHPTKPNKLSVQIRSTGETAYQRAVFLSQKTYLHSLGEIVWNDLELPIVFNKSSRRRCVDLVGTLNNKTPVLCELKVASKRSNSNSPIYAIVELLIYYYLIHDNHEELDKKNVFHKNEQVKSFKWKDFNQNSIFIIGANETYWMHWGRRYEIRKNEIGSWRRSLPLTIHFFSFEDSNFEEQKKAQGGKTYRPSVSSNTGWKEVNL